MKRRGRPPYPDVLTPRQQDVWNLLREGLTNEQIAERLGISSDGVKWHVSEILGKLGVSSRQEAARWIPAERARWWSLAFLPVGVLRDGSSWVAKAVAVASVTVVAGGIGLLIWGVATTWDRGNARTVAPAMARTGIAEVDRAIDMLVRQDVDALMSLVEYQSVACSVEQTIGSPPPCPPGSPQGTPIDTFHLGACEGYYVTTPDEVRAAFGASLLRQPNAAVYAVVRGDGEDDANGYTIAVTPDMPSLPTAPVSMWHVTAEGRIDALTDECGTTGAAQRIEGWFSQPDYVLGPFMNCIPGPGETANVMVRVESLSPGGIRPQFSGQAFSTIGTATGERAIVLVTDETEWIGDLDRLEDVRPGMQLQAVGVRRSNCLINTQTILTPASPTISNAALGFESVYPYGWNENAEPMPYAVCTGCVTLGPSDVRYPYGISVYSAGLNAGCPPSCYFSIRALAVTQPVSRTIDGRIASQQEIERQAPLGLAAETGDSTPYHTLATVIHRDEDTLVVVGYFRVGDSDAERKVRSAYDRFLERLSISDPPAQAE